MFNMDYEFSQDTLRDMLHFPHGNGIAYACPLEEEWQYDAFYFWEQLTCERTSDWEGLKSSHIHSPAIRYVHRILANIIFGRINNGMVNSKELFFLHTAFAPTRVNATPFMLAHLKLLCVRGTTHFCIGGLVTSIARALGLDSELATLQPLPTPSLDIDSCRAQHLIKAKKDNIYSLMVGNLKIRSIILPCHTCTNVRNRNNWLYDLTAPELSHPAPNDIPV